MVPCVLCHSIREALNAFYCILFGDAFVHLGAHWNRPHVLSLSMSVPFLRLYKANVQFERFILAHLRSQLVVLIASTASLCMCRSELDSQYECSKCTTYLPSSLHVCVHGAAKFYEGSFIALYLQYSNSLESVSMASGR